MCICVYLGVMKRSMSRVTTFVILFLLLQYLLFGATSLIYNHNYYIQLPLSYILYVCWCDETVNIEGKQTHLLIRHLITHSIIMPYQFTLLPSPMNLPFIHSLSSQLTLNYTHLVLQPSASQPILFSSTLFSTTPSFTTPFFSTLFHHR